MPLLEVNSWPLLDLAAVNRFLSGLYRNIPPSLFVILGQQLTQCTLSDAGSYKTRTHTASYDRPWVWYDATSCLIVSLCTETTSTSTELDLLTGEPCPKLPAIASPSWANQNGPLTFPQKVSVSSALSSMARRYIQQVNDKNYPYLVK